MPRPGKQWVANFLNYGLRDPQAGLEMARAALALNPRCSAELWNVCGHCLWSLGRIREAQGAYERALQVNPDDVMGRYSLAWVYLHYKEHGEALRLIAEGLARDWRGDYRERLLQKQAEVLADLARRSRQEYQALINRVSQPSPSPGREAGQPEAKPQATAQRRQGNTLAGR
jgi:tetratricopeptide (TPR) repeat protein